MAVIDLIFLDNNVEQTGFRGCLVENDRSEKVVKSGQIFENSRRIAGYLTRIFGNMADFTGFVADLFLTRQPLNSYIASNLT